MKPLRIAFITPLFPLKGGIARFSGLLRDALFGRGYEVVPVPFRALYPDFLMKDVAAAQPALEAAPSEKTTLVLYNPFTWIGTIRQLRELKPDILLVAYWSGFLAPLYSVIYRLTGIRMVVLLHNLSSHESFFFEPMMQRLLAAFADGVITLSEAVSREARVAMPHTPLLSLFHPLYEPEGEIPSRHDARSRLRIDDCSPVLLFFGYVRPYKGLEMMLDAMPSILSREPSLRLVVAGQFHEELSVYRRLIEQLGIGESVDLYPGYVSPECTSLYFAAADAVVLPYRNATQSGVVPLAYGYGRPVIVTPAGALPEMVSHGKTGWVARDLSPEGFAQAVREFLDSRESLGAMRPAIEAFGRGFSWETFAASAGSFLETIAARR